MNEPWTSLKLIQWTAGYFEKKGIPNPRLDAELLLAHVLKCKRIDLYVSHENQVSEKDLAKFKELIERRAKREPLQYIVGETEFWGLKFKVTPDVLIPRPETELLVEEAIKANQSFPKPNALNPTPCILDIGTGSGCVAIALAKNLPNAHVTATEFSKGAFAVAQENIARHQMEDRIKLILADLAPWRVFEAEGTMFDVIVSNPPYIAAGDIDALQEEVAHHEPRMALDGGPDGLDLIRRILQEASSYLRSPGLLMMEVGEDQGQRIAALPLPSQELRLKEIKKDLNGHDRIVSWTR